MALGRRATRGDRLTYLFCCLGALALLITARVLTPSPTGVGTHRQLGLPPCSFEVMTGHGCPGCGMTTAFSHMAHGQVAEAFDSNPMGIVLFALIALGGAFAGYRVVRPRPFDEQLGTVTSQVIVYSLIAALMISWVVRLLIGRA